MNADSFRKKYGPWATITGGSSGIGAEFARQLAAMGLNLILVARRQEQMQQLAAKLMQLYKIEIRIVTVDLSDADFMSSIVPITQDLEIGLLVNAAGFALTGALLDHNIEDEVQLLNVNCRAPLLLAHHFGGKMRDNKHGGIVFLSSIVAFSGVPQWSNYAASKSYNLLLAEALRNELKSDGVDVLALAPGPTKTEFQQVAGIRDSMVMKVEKIVAAGLHSLGKKAVVIPGILNQYNNFWLRFFPRRLNTRIFGAIIKRVKK